MGMVEQAIVTEVSPARMSWNETKAQKSNSVRSRSYVPV
jgi:hypothetical protein